MLCESALLTAKPLMFTFVQAASMFWKEDQWIKHDRVYTITKRYSYSHGSHLQLVGDLSCGTVAPEVPKDLVSQFEGGAHLRSERDLRPGSFASFCTSGLYFHIFWHHIIFLCCKLQWSSISQDFVGFYSGASLLPYPDVLMDLQSAISNPHVGSIGRLQQLKYRAGGSIQVTFQAWQRS